MMKAYTTLTDLRQARKALPGSFGLVPTMGALHEGHLSLVRPARAENGHVGVSIFVNPTQFGPNEDLSKYPRLIERDLQLLEAEGADLVWMPTPDMVYPPGFQTHVNAETVTQPLEGGRRPGHFRGVATVVAKLFNAFTPDRAYFGRKDAQQVVVIKRMAAELGEDRVALGITTQGATLLAPGHAREGGRGPIHVADHPRLTPLVDLLPAVNPLTAILRVPNGELLNRPDALCRLVRAMERASI